MSLEYDPRAGNIQRFLNISCSGLNAAYVRDNRKHSHTHTHTHTHTTISLITHFSFFLFFLVFCNWLASWCSGGQQAQQRLPSRPIDLSSAHRVKADGMRERLETQPLFLWQPAGACLGLFLVSSDCFSFRVQRCAALRRRG